MFLLALLRPCGKLNEMDRQCTWLVVQMDSGIAHFDTPVNYIRLPSDFTIDQMLIFRQTSSFDAVCKTGGTVINPLTSRIYRTKETCYYTVQS